jgi:hypothetical protein
MRIEARPSLPRIVPRVVLIALLVSAHALGLAEDARVEVGIAIGEGGRQTVHGDVNISRTGLTAAEVQQMMSDLLNKDSLNAQRAAELEQQVETLSAEIGVRKSVVENFLRLLGEAEIPVDDLGAKLEEIARRHLDLLERWSLLEEDDDPAIRKLTDAAKAAIDAGDYDRADQLLAEAEGQDLAAARQAQELAAQATAAANRRFLSAAAKRSKRGELRLIQFDYEGAARHFQEAADLVPPGEPLVLAGYLMRAGSAWSGAARFAQAQPLVERALSIREQNLGSEHPDVAGSLNDLAVLHLHQAQLAEAEPLMRRALAIDEVSYGAEHPNVARDLNNLAWLLKETNRLSEAEPLMRRALAIDEASYGAEHPKVTIDLNNLALLLQATNRLSEAEPLMRRALAIDEASYGAEHPKVAIALNNLAQLLQATNRLSEAEPLMRRVVSIFEVSYGEEHPNVATALNNLALLLQATNRLSEAEPLMRRALAIDEASYGAEHPDVARDLNNLAQLLQATNRLSEAEPLMRRALAIDEASYGAEHPNVARDLNNLAQLLQDTNRLSEAEPYSRQAVLIFLAFTRDTGHRHPHLEVIFSNYTGILSAGEWTETEMQERLLSLGPEAGLEESIWVALRGELGDTD